MKTLLETHHKFIQVDEFGGGHGKENSSGYGFGHGDGYGTGYYSGDGSGDGAGHGSGFGAGRKQALPLSAALPPSPCMPSVEKERPLGALPNLRCARFRRQTGQIGVELLKVGP